MPAKSNKKKNTKPAQRRPKSAVLAINNYSQNKSPQLRTNASGTTVSHTEIVMEGVSLDNTFSVDAMFALQPALTTYNKGSPIGTWLPGVAAKYDMYEFQSLRFRFVTSAASTQAGTIALACDPNPDGGKPTSFSDMRNMKPSVSGPARTNLTLDVTPVVRGRKLLTRQSTVTSLPPYDAGKVYLAGFNGTATPVIVGYLEVDYVIKLSNPQTSPNLDIVGTLPGINPMLAVDIPYHNSTVSAWNVGFTTGTSNPNAMTTQVYQAYQTPTLRSGMSDLITFISPFIRTYNQDFIEDGIVFKTLNGISWNAFKFKYVGRYRIRLTWNGDWFDKARYGFKVLTFAGDNPSTDTIQSANDAAIGSDGSIVLTKAQWYGWRGFNSGTTGTIDFDDPCPSIDVTVYASSTTRPYFLGCGAMPVNQDLSENNVASYNQSATLTAGNSRCYFSVEYLSATS